MAIVIPYRSPVVKDLALREADDYFYSGEVKVTGVLAHSTTVLKGSYSQCASGYSIPNAIVGQQVNFPPYNYAGGGNSYVKRYSATWGYTGPDLRGLSVIEVGESSYVVPSNLDHIFHDYLSVRWSTLPSYGVPAPTYVGVSGSNTIWTETRGLNDYEIFRKYLPVAVKQPRVEGGVTKYDLFMYYNIIGPYGSSAGGYASAFRAAISNKEAAAYRNALLDRQVVNIGTTLVEIAEIRKLLLGGLVSFVKAFGFLLKHPFNSTYEALSFLRKLSAQWLAWSYGIKPLLQTIYDLFVGLCEKTPLSVFVLNGKPFQVDLVQTVKFGTGSLGGGATNGVCSKGVTSVVSQEITTLDGVEIYRGPALSGAECGSYTLKNTYKCKPEWTLKGSPVYELSRYGLVNPASMVWEAIPFSFIIDWFVRVGDSIDMFEADRGLTILGSQHSNEILYSHSTSWGGTASGSAFRRYRDGKTLDGILLHSDIFDTPPPLSYAQPKVRLGSMVSDWNARAANAASLLVVLQEALSSIRQNRAILENKKTRELLRRLVLL